MIAKNILEDIRQATTVDDLLIAENRLTAYILSAMYAIAAIVYILLYNFIPITPLVKNIGIAIFVIVALLCLIQLRSRLPHPMSSILVSVYVVIPFMYTYFFSRPFLSAYIIASYWLLLLLCGFYRSEYIFVSVLFACALTIIGLNLAVISDIIQSNLISFIIPELIIFLLVIIISYTIIFANRAKTKLLLERIETIAFQTDQVSQVSADLEVHNKMLADKNDEIVKLNKSLDYINSELLQKNDHLKDQRIQLTQLAYYDPMTHVMKRQTFIDEMQAKIQFLDQSESLAILLIDIDNFKSINDTVGDMYGDEIIIQLCQRIQQEFVDTRSIGRMVGDCFGLVMKSDMNREQLIAFINDKKAIIDRKLSIGDIDINYTTSIGAVIYPTHGSSANNILKFAEIALSQAKSTGKNKLFIYDDVIKADIRRRNLIVNEFQYALSHGEFSLHFQPIISLDDEKLVGFEALLRWESRNLGTVGPGEFIPIAEASGAIYDIGQWVFDQACGHYNIFRSYMKDDFYISLNLSTYQLLSSSFIDEVAGTLERHHVDPKHIAIEITESAFNKFSDPVINKIIELKQMGFIISIDDFGSGFFTFEYFLKLDIDILKIDKSFLDTVFDRESVSSVVIEHMINMFTAMGKHVICEGVEQQQQVDYLRTKACHAIQGYYYSRPLDYDAILSYIERQTQM